MKVLGFLLRAVGNKRFVTGYWTTLFRTIYYPTRVVDPYVYHVTLKHECVHIAQWDKWNILFSISYLLLPMPFFLAWFRWRWEREAYLVNIRAAVDRELAIERIVDSLWTGYGWPWPRKRMRKWFLEHA